MHMSYISSFKLHVPIEQNGAHLKSLEKFIQFKGIAILFSMQ